MNGAAFSQVFQDIKKRHCRGDEYSQLRTGRIGKYNETKRFLCSVRRLLKGFGAGKTVEAIEMLSKIHEKGVVTDNMLYYTVVGYNTLMQVLAEGNMIEVFSKRVFFYLRVTMCLSSSKISCTPDMPADGLVGNLQAMLASSVARTVCSVLRRNCLHRVRSNGGVMHGMISVPRPVCAKALHLAAMEDKTKLGKPVKIMTTPSVEADQAESSAEEKLVNARD
ncbi:unnamed protein product [Arabis nemorensis]|uniref:Uncharacterized protein n=1 Tax=Arabis nemorensis TaxID=586526 RepID=A0A565BGW7_9BRAS|nr:unnamed protein product [Arabis nemorensis]